MKRILIGFAAGVIFGVGLIVSQMSNPAKVVGFLDLFGEWDPTLAFVMAGALAVFIPAYRMTLGRGRPLFGVDFSELPNIVDRQLVLGAGIFGVGWGLSGFCPGPAIVAAGFGDWHVWLFLAAMLIGMLGARAAAIRGGYLTLST
jgi:uncharacterized membrane protein YedE/YeeE